MKNNYKKYFCTFASSNMSKALDRIKRQARDLDFFDGIFIYDENRLDNTFREKFKDKLKSKVRSFGYWVWKPQIILQSLEKIDMGDILLYTDAGCHLNKKGVKKLEEYFEGVNKSELGIGVTQFVIKSKDSALVSGQNFEKEWTKGDIFSFFNVLDKEEIYNTGQYQSTVLFVKKTEKTLDFIKKWALVFEQNFNLVDDSPSKSKNFEEFKENRHDQSILSILLKIQDTPPFSIPASEIEQTNWKLLEKYPILAKRDRGLSILNRIRRKFAPYRINKYIRL
ncbi:MAG: hypothetical protein WC280_03500 [Patescibacteria group bacterium]